MGGRVQGFFVALAASLVVFLFSPSVSFAEETPRTTRQHAQGDCVNDTMVIDSTWRVWVPDGAPGASAASVAEIMAAGEFLMGCEDEYPLPTLGVQAPGSPGCFGNIVCFNDHATDNTATVSLATFDELGGPALNPTIGLHAFYGFPYSWWDNLDDPEDEQHYLIAYVPGDPAAQQGPKVLIVGASQDGLQYGVIDWLKSIERVRFEDFSGPRDWSPDPASPLADECSSYGTSGCFGDKACWNTSSLSWTPATELEWCPDQVLNYPDVPTRLGFSGFGAGAANFIPNVLSKSFGVGGTDCDATASPPVSENDWWQQNVLECDRTGTVMVFGAPKTPCQEALVRLDSLVWGKYTHAMDESYAAWQSSRLEYDTECQSEMLYEQLWEYLRQRRVLLVPAGFGLEARSQEEPIGRRLKDEAGTWYASEWGKYGDFTRSEGLSVREREFAACSDGSGTYFLSPAVDSLSWDGLSGMTDCDHLDVVTGAAVSDVPRVGPVVDFAGTSLPGLSVAGIVVGTAAGCWASSTSTTPTTDAWGEYGYPTSDDCDLDITFPLDSSTEDRLFAVTFQAVVPTVGLQPGLIPDRAKGPDPATN